MIGKIAEVRSAVQSFAECGYFVQNDLLASRDCQIIADKLDAHSMGDAGSRLLLQQPWCKELAVLLKRNSVMQPLLPREAVAVQCTLFAKTRRSNWSVTAHQDLSIPVAERVGSPACTGWSEKQGCLFVQPPSAVLEDMVAVRLHIDDAAVDSGALRVIPGSHRSGRMPVAKLKAQLEFRTEHICTVRRGGVMAMRPLLLHASAKVTSPTNRRVLHFLFGPPGLPLGLRWSAAV